jgi:hypothetical protein
MPNKIGYRVLAGRISLFVAPPYLIARHYSITLTGKAPESHTEKQKEHTFL